MKTYEFRDKENPVLPLLPGNGGHWKNNFGPVIPLLEDKFHVVCVSYDRFDETEKTVQQEGTTYPDYPVSIYCAAVWAELYAVLNGNGIFMNWIMQMKADGRGSASYCFKEN